jgi:predicted dehydrogenase
MAGLPYLVSAGALGQQGRAAPSERVAMASIGVGSMGGYHLGVLLGYPDVQVVAACDVREMFRLQARWAIEGKYGPGACKVYSDFRELLARDDFDAVVIATPEHWHALVGIEAARRGMSMYYEKPMDVHVAANKALRQAVRESGVTFQFGTQQRSDAGFRRACELARNGRLGKLHTIIVGSYPSPDFPNQPSEPMPDRREFDYDMWLGPAQWAPYCYERAASRAMGTIGLWTHIYDYSLGGLSGAWGIHHIDIAQWANAADETGPLEVSGRGTFPKDGIADTATAWEIEHVYANGVRMIHMDSRTAVEKVKQFSLHRGEGVLLIGDAGWVLVCRDLIVAEPEDILKEIIGPDEINLYRSDDHRRNFIDCMKTGRQTICPIEAAVRSDTICHLDDIAMRLCRKLRWDPAKEEFINDAEANRMLARPLRSPWRL